MNLTPEQSAQMKVKITQIVKENARIQKSKENRDNYFNSCLAHDGIVKEVVEEVKKEFI